MNIFLMAYIALGLTFTLRWIGIPKSINDIACWFIFPLMWSHVIFYLIGKSNSEDNNDGEYIPANMIETIWRPLFSPH